MNGRIAGKIVLVTGGASGIGLACAEACAREGATVVITDVNVADGESQARRLATVEQETLAGWRRTQAVNMEGVFLGTREAIRVMKKRGGSIINISSIEGIIGEPLTAAYNASKGGVRVFTKSAALHCAQQGYAIRVNSVHPGFIGTPLVANALGALPPDEAAALHQDLMTRIPLRRLGEPREIASGVLFLASDESSYMTGSELVIDGGYTAR